MVDVVVVDLDVVDVVVVGFVVDLDVDVVVDRFSRRL